MTNVQMCFKDLMLNDNLKTKNSQHYLHINYVILYSLTWRRPIVVLISFVSPTVTMLDLSIWVMRRSQSAISVARLFKSVGATVSAEYGARRWESSLAMLAMWIAEGTEDTEQVQRRVKGQKMLCKTKRAGCKIRNERNIFNILLMF